MLRRLGYFARDAVYGTPILGRVVRQFLENRRGVYQHSTKEYWDKNLATTAKSYLGGTVQVDARDALANSLIRHHAPTARSLLDLGCAGGSLGYALDPNIVVYHGVDISEVAITAARKGFPGRSHSTREKSFTVSDLRSFQPPSQFDVIVFNEVLYYLNIEWIEQELNRYAKFLSPDGIVIVSLKDDALSHLIHKAIAKTYTWEYGALFQLQPSMSSFKLRYNREQPPFLQSVFRPRRSAA